VRRPLGGIQWYSGEQKKEKMAPGVGHYSKNGKIGTKGERPLGDYPARESGRLDTSSEPRPLNMKRFTPTKRKVRYDKNLGENVDGRTRRKQDMPDKKKEDWGAWCQTPYFLWQIKKTVR